MNDIQRVKEATDIVTVIEAYVTLQRSGANFVARCPFHQENTPSFFVSPDRQFWHCYGACGEGGDVLSFLMKAENMDFQQALRHLAQQAGIELASFRKKRTDPNEPLYRLMAQAAAYFRQAFLQEPEAQTARAYVQRRGITDEISERFQLGYNTWDRTSLLRFMTKQDAAPADLTKLGLLYHDTDRNRHLDRFRGRLMIPIRNDRNQVIGFGARVLDETRSRGPKYLNSPTTPLFEKRRVLYGIDQAKGPIRRARQAVLVEGYMDVIAAHQYGCENTVACMGTAITPDQIGILRRYTPEIVFALDADAAGQSATMRGLQRAREALVQNPGSSRSARNLVLRIATMPKGQDPDDMIRNDGEGWQRLVREAASLVDFYASYVADVYDLNQPEQKQEATDVLVEVIAEIDHLVTRAEYCKRVARRLSIAEDILLQLVEMAHRRRTAPKQERERPAQAPPAPSPAENWTPAASVPREDFLLGVLFRNPASILYPINQWLQRHQQGEIGEKDFERTENREIFKAMEAVVLRGHEWRSNEFATSLAEPLQVHFRRLQSVSASVRTNSRREVSTAALENLIEMRREAINRRIQNISHEVDMAQAIPVQEWGTELYQDRQRLDMAIHSIHKDWHNWIDE